MGALLAELVNVCVSFFNVIHCLLTFAGTTGGMVGSNWDTTHPLPSWSQTTLPLDTQELTSLFMPVCKWRL